MNTLEDRLRDAYRAAAETVRPEAVLPDGVRGLRGRDRRPVRKASHLWSRSRLLIPLAAAAVVAAVAVTVSALAPRAVPRIATGPGAAAAPAATPAFFVALNWRTHPSLFVVNAATGARGTAISLPFPVTDLDGVATGNGRTFVAAARSAACRTSLYRFGLSAAGTPTAMTQFATVPGAISSPWDMAVTGNGQTIAYDAAACGQAGPGVTFGRTTQPVKGYLAVANTRTGKTRRWTFEIGTGAGDTAFHGIGDVSLSADGRTVAFSDWVVPARAAPGPLTQRGRVVARNGEFGPSTILGGLDLAPDGKTVYFGTFRVRHHKPVARNWQLRAFGLATGRTQLLRSIPGSQGTPAAVASDPTGRFLLVESAPRPGITRLARLDLATGQVTQLNARWAVEAAIAW